MNSHEISLDMALSRLEADINCLLPEGDWTVEYQLGHNAAVLAAIDLIRKRRSDYRVGNFTSGDWPPTEAFL